MDAALTNRTFAAELGGKLVESVTAVGPDSRTRIISGVAIFDPRSDYRDSSDVQLWMAQPERIDASLLMASLGHSNVPGIVLDHVPESFDTGAIRHLTESTGVAIWCRGESVSWLQLLDEARQLIQSGAEPASAIGGNGATGDIPRLAEALADFLGGSVIIEDARFSVLGYSVDAMGQDVGRDAAILKRSMPPEWVNYLASKGVLDRLRATDDVIKLDGGPFLERQRFIAPIKADRRLVGVIWVAA